MKNFTAAQSIATMTFLSEWDEDYTFNSLLGDLSYSQEGITVCAMYEYINRLDLAEAIKSLAIDIQIAIDDERRIINWGDYLNRTFQITRNKQIIDINKEPNN
jgi:hypothetical protein